MNSSARVKQKRDCSQIENEDEEEEEDWQKEDQMGLQCAEDEKSEDILERRRMEGISLHAEVMQKVLEMVVYRRDAIQAKQLFGGRFRRNEGKEIYP